MIFVDYLPGTIPPGLACTGNRAIHLFHGRTFDARDCGIECLEVATADNPNGVNDVLLLIIHSAAGFNLDDRLAAGSGTPDSRYLCRIPSGTGCSAKILEVRYWRPLIFQGRFESPDVAPGTVGSGSLVFAGRVVADTEGETAGGLSDTG